MYGSTSKITSFGCVLNLRNFIINSLFGHRKKRAIANMNNTAYMLLAVFVLVIGMQNMLVTGCSKYKVYSRKICILGKFAGPGSRPVLFIKNICADYFWTGRLTSD